MLHKEHFFVDFRSVRHLWQGEAVVREGGVKFSKLVEMGGGSFSNAVEFGGGVNI